MNDNLLALSVAAIVFFGGAATAILFYRLDIKDSAVIIALLAAPLLVYGISSGMILEFSAPGGWNAKFREATRQKVTATATPLTDGLNKLQQVEKEGLPRLPEKISQLEPGKPVALVLYFGKKGYYIADVVEDYAKQLSAFDPDTVVIIVDDDSKRFVCMIEANSFLSIFREARGEMTRAISDRDRGYLMRFPGFIFKGIRDNRTNVDALKEMRGLDLKSLVVLDKNDKPISIVKRDELITHLFDKLTD